MLTGHSAVLPTVTAFAVAFALGALLYTLQRQLDDAIRRIRLCWFGGDAIALLAMLVTLYAFKHEVASAIPDDINPATLITNIHIALFVTMAGGWVVLALSERLPRILLWLLRVSVLIIAGAFIVAGGIVVDVVKLPFTTRFVNLGVASAPLTIAWLVLLSAVFQSTARVAGLSLGIGAAASLAFWAVATAVPQRLTPVAIIIVAIIFGTCMGLMPWLLILRHAFTTFATASTIGVALAIISIAGALKNTAFLIVVAPLVILGIPLVETTYTLRAMLPAIRLDEHRRARISFFELLAAEGLIGQRLWVVLVLANAYLCIIAIALVALIRIHFTLKILLLIAWGTLGAMLLILAARLLTQKPPPAQASVYMLGVPVCTLNMERVLQRIEEFIAERQPRIIVTADTSALIRAQEDTEFRDIIRNADIVTPDGIGVVLAARLLGFPLTQRVSGVDLMRRLCELAGQRGYRIFLLGARPGVVERAAMRLRQLYPTLTIVGMHHGYFDASQELHIIKCIRDAHPDILFVAMGIPKQEKWIAKHLNELNVPVSIGVGGSFDVYAGVAKRAPRWVQRLCLEWLYRALREPHRVKRLIAIPKLLILVARSILRQI